MEFGPKKITFSELMLNSLGSLIAGVIGSITIIIITFIISNYINIPATFKSGILIAETSTIFPIVLSIITLLGITITMYLSYLLLTITSAERYKRSITISGQIAFFGFISYLFIAPVYIYTGLIRYDYIMYVFLVHILLVTFGTNIIIEVINNYRRILIGIYGSFVGLFISIFLTILIFTSFSTGYAKLISLIVLLPIISFCTTFFKQVFEYAYYNYYLYTNQDQLGNIFYQIEIEEREALNEEEEKNTI
ncbi:MAG: hypothetical protein Q8K30_03785 [Candidatus Gracilibacteria bacterium]|nr:hypothetical protein [Candidatus Gracilibacteria bacterium]